MSRATVYRWRDSSATFRAALKAANEDANDTIDDAVVLRAIEGIEEPLVSMGQLVYELEPMRDDNGKIMFDKHGDAKMLQVGQVKVRKYSDGLLIALAKSRMMKYRDRADLDLLEQINENTGGAVVINTKDMTADELGQLKALAQSIKARQARQQGGN